MENIKGKLFSSVVLIAIAVLLLVFARQFVQAAGFLLGCVFLLIGIQKIISYLVFIRHNDVESTAGMLLLGIVTLVLGLFLFLNPNILDSILKLIVAIWMFLMGAISLIITYTYHRDGEKYWWLMLLDALASIVIAILVLFNPLVWEFFLSILLPIQLLIGGISSLAEVLPTKHRKLRIKAPSWMQAFLPQKTIHTIKETIKENVDALHTTPHVRFSDAEFAVDDIEVLVHLSERSSSAFGHVDLAFGDYVLSYGNYDHSKKAIRLFGMLYDGIFYIVPRKEYLKFSLSEAGKTILGYQLSINDDQKMQIKKRVDEFLQNCEPWRMSEQDAIDSEYAWRIQEYGGTLFRVVKSRFRTYFVLNTNCALLSEVLLGDAGVPRAHSVGGAVTPGSVYAMYEKIYEAKNPLIAARNIYLGDELLNNIGHETIAKE